MKIRSASLLCISIALSSTGCKSHPDVPARAAPTTQYVVLVDMSASRDAKSQKDNRDFIDKLSTALSYGDQLVLLPVQQQGVRDEIPPVIGNMPNKHDTSRPPSPSDEEKYQDEQNNTIDGLSNFWKQVEGRKILHTDLLATLAIAGDYVRQRTADRTEIILLSDMLQSAQEIEMENGKAPPPKDWVLKHHQSNQIPNLKGVCIAVIGEDKTAKRDPEVRQFWSDYFNAAGTKLDENHIWISPPTDVKFLCQ